MNQDFRSLLMPIHAGKVNERVIALARSAVKFAGWLDAELHVVLAPDPDISEALRLEESLNAEAERNIRFRVETDRGSLDEATISAAHKRNPDVVILAVDPTHLRRKAELLPWQRRILEEVAHPILMIPSTMELRAFESILVPMSGEQARVSSALELGLKFGNRVHIPVDILHVTPRNLAQDDPSVVGRLSDEFHHEYPRLVDEMIAEASPFSSVRERSILREFLHVRGDTAREIFRNLRDRPRGLLIVEWKGTFAQGHAETVKSIFRASRYPVLLIKPAQEAQSTLRLGDKPIAA